MEQIVDIKIIEDGGYAVWGLYRGEIVFIHLTELSKTKPIPDNKIPTVGDIVRVKIFKEVQPNEEVPLDVSKDGKYAVRYAASIALLEEQEST